LKELIVHIHLLQRGEKGIPLYMNLKQGVSLISFRKEESTNISKKKTPKNSINTVSREFFLSKGLLIHT
jgi:hypothetical protein